MLISFIVPSYNRAALLPRAIDSVLAQRQAFAHGMEIVVVDDGSTDDTATVLERFRDDPSVVVIRHSPNQGLARARNAAIARARGAWCALLDSDNALLPDAAPRLETILLGLPHDVGVLWAESVDPNGRSTVQHEVAGRVAGRETLGGRISGEHFSVIRTSVARAHPYPELGTRHACEPAFWAAIALDCDFHVARERLQYYETDGADRFCALSARIGRARELAVCYEHTANLVREAAPAYHWQLLGKAAFFRTVAGDWRGGSAAAVRLAPGLLHAWRNAAVIASCLAGPSVSRWLLRRTAPE